MQERDCIDIEENKYHNPFMENKKRVKDKVKNKNG